jgi:polyhydroxyalkanoate synthesis regulator phasin
MMPEDRKSAELLKQQRTVDELCDQIDKLEEQIEDLRAELRVAVERLK